MLGMLDFPGGAGVKNLPAIAGHAGGGVDPQVGTIPRAGNGNPPQSFLLENFTDGRAWWLQSIGLKRVRHD